MKRRYLFPSNILLLGIIASSSSLYAHHQWEFIIDGGPNWFESSNYAKLKPTDIETDSLSKSRSYTNGDLGLGVYIKTAFPYKRSINQMSWLNTIGVGLNLRFSGFDNDIISGKVYQFQQSNLDNYRYKLRFDNTRLLAQIMLDLLAYKQFSIATVGGLGGGWTSLQYHDVPIAGVDGGGLTLAKKDSNKLVWDVGVNINYYYNTHFAGSLGYLYTDYGRISPKNHGSLNGQVVQLSAPSFSLQSHALLVGLHYIA